jgi:hypothetical protein
LGDLGVVEPAILRQLMTPFLAGAQPPGAYRFWDITRLEAWLQPRMA